MPDPIIRNMDDLLATIIDKYFAIFEKTVAHGIHRFEINGITAKSTIRMRAASDRYSGIDEIITLYLTGSRVRVFYPFKDDPRWIKEPTPTQEMQLRLAL